MVMFQVLQDRPRPVKTLFAATMLTVLCWSTASAQAPRIWPNTSIRLNIVQWVPTKGIYERWDALSGEFTVTQDGALSLPVIGRLPVGNLDEAGLSARIAEELKNRLTAKQA